MNTWSLTTTSAVDGTPHRADGIAASGDAATVELVIATHKAIEAAADPERPVSMFHLELDGEQLGVIFTGDNDGASIKDTLLHSLYGQIVLGIDADGRLAELLDIYWASEGEPAVGAAGQTQRSTDEYAAPRRDAGNAR